MTESLDLPGSEPSSAAHNPPAPPATVSPEFFVDMLRIAMLSSQLLEQARRHMFDKKQDKRDASVFYARPLNAEACARLLKELSEVVFKMRMSGLDAEIASPTSEALDVNPRLTNALFGKHAQAGEMLRLMLGAYETGAPVDLEAMLARMGIDKAHDATALTELGTDLAAVCRAMGAKLREEYPEASPPAAVNPPMVGHSGGKAG